MRSLDIASSGMQAQQTNVDVISNNIANMTTTAYRRQRAEFQDLIYQNMRLTGSDSSDQGTQLPSGAQLGLGVKTAAIYRIDEQGTLQQTSNSLDLAIQGNGWIPVTLPSGDTAYTRDGSFGLSSSGQIVTADGYTVGPGITIPTNATAITIDESGDVQVTTSGSTTPTTVGNIQLAAFPNDDGLQALGQNLFMATPSSGAAVLGTPNANGYGSLMQGYVEASNVNVVTEVTNLITAQRAYQMNSQVITAADQMLQTLTNLK